MYPALKAELEAAISEFIEKSCEHDRWPAIYVSATLSMDMANAAESVFDAVVNHEANLKAEGYMEE